MEDNFEYLKKKFKLRALTVKLKREDFDRLNSLSSKNLKRRRSNDDEDSPNAKKINVVQRKSNTCQKSDKFGICLRCKDVFNCECFDEHICVENEAKSTIDTSKLQLCIEILNSKINETKLH